MSVNYTAVLAVGKEFTTLGQAVRFLRSHNLLTEYTEDELDHLELEHCMPAGLTFESLDLYSSDYFYVGIKLKPRDVEGFRGDFEDAVDMWDKYFPDSPPEMIHTVRYS